MDPGDLIYVLIGVIWLIYSFLKAKKKKTTSDLSGLPGDEMTDDVMTEQPAEEYLPSDLSSIEGREVVEQVEDPYETVRKEVLILSEPVVSESAPDEGEESYIEQLKGATQTPALTLPTRAEAALAGKGLTHSLKKKMEVLPFGEGPGEGLPDFDLRKAVIFYEILKRPEY